MAVVHVYAPDGRWLGTMSEEQYEDSAITSEIIRAAFGAARDSIEQEVRAMERRPYDSHLRCPHCGKRMIVEVVVRRGEEDLVHVCWTCSYEEVP